MLLASRRLQSAVASSWHSLASRSLRYSSSQAIADDDGQFISKKRLRQFLEAEVSHFQNQPQTGFPGLEELLFQSATPRRAARYLNREIPSRFARRIRQIENIADWQEVPELADCHARYSESFRSLRMVDFGDVNSSLSSLTSMSLSSMSDPAAEGSLGSSIDSFTQLIRELKERQSKVLPLIGASMQKLAEMDPEMYDAKFWNAWLDRFLRSRICTEMLTSQYLTVCNQALRGETNLMGIVDPLCNPYIVTSMAAQNASKLCKGFTGLEPVINIQSAVDADLEHSRFSYIPTYLHYILLEILKNSSKATAKKAETQEGMKKRPINIVICADKHRVAIRISDLGGGIPFDVGDRVWDFLYKESGGTGATELSGYGIGLPNARLYAEYLGGSLTLMSLPDYGVDAFLFLRRIKAQPGDMDMESEQSFDFD